MHAVLREPVCYGLARESETYCIIFQIESNGVGDCVRSHGIGFMSK